MDERNSWLMDHQLWVEVFVLLNFTFLTFDIYIAHSVNLFRRQAEYVPLIFSMCSPVLLLAALVARKRWEVVWRDIGYLVGWLAVLVGLAGVIFHLDSGFFYERTIKSLTYAAPFAAPLDYTGLGLLLIMSRMVDPESAEWAKWVLLLVLGGFFGDFVLSLTDHAVNGFFRPVEWVPVISSAFAVGFLAVPLLMKVTRPYLFLSAVVLLLQAGVGILGFMLHTLANLKGPSTSAYENFVNGAPPMAPLLFPNLVVLGWIALWRIYSSKDFRLKWAGVAIKRDNAILN